MRIESVFFEYRPSTLDGDVNGDVAMKYYLANGVKENCEIAGTQSNLRKKPVVKSGS